MKNLYRVGLFISILAFALFSCNHGANGTGGTPQNGGGGSTNNAPDLTLVSMHIHGVKVENDAVTVHAGTIESGNIKAKFKYGTVNEEEIAVVLVDSPFSIAEEETKELNLKVEAVKDKHKGWNGKVTVTAEKAMPKLLSGIIMTGGRNQGSLQREVINKEKLDGILKGETPTIEVLGPIARVIFLSIDKEWTSITVGGKTKRIQKLEGFKSVALHAAVLVKPEPEEVSFEIAMGEEKIQGKIMLLRKADKADISELELYINDKEITKKADDEPQGELLEVLWKNNYEISVGGDSANIQVASFMGFIKEVTINGNKVIPTKKKIGGGTLDYNVAEYKIEGLTDEAQEVKVEITPTLPTIFNPVTWQFKIKK